MERGSNVHSPRVDDAMRHETEGLTRSGRSTHAAEWREPEPAGEDQPDVDRMPDGALVGGVPPGIGEDEIEGRSELARWLDRSVFPAVGQQLLENAARNHAPEVVLGRLRALPSGREYANVQDVWSALGGGVEQRT